MTHEQDALQGSVQLLPEIRPRFQQGPSRFKQYVLPFILLLISVITTTAIGARYMQNFRDGVPSVVSESDLWPWPWLVQQPSRFQLGWPFSLTLLAILLTHEFGHYFACKAHGIRCTLPWVLPAPTLSGTAGAVIQIRSRIPNRQALMDVGAYGPLAGYAASLLAVFAGWMLSHPISRVTVKPLIHFGEPVTLTLMHHLVQAVGRPIVSATFLEMPAFRSTLIHPVFLSGWIGLFITALNLIPAGQLDGGHILFAVSPRWHRWMTRVLPFVLIGFGIFFWVGWVFWGALLWIPAMRHPNVANDQPVGGRNLLALLCLGVFLLTFVAAPFADSSIRAYLH